ncbi:TetR/AcrR family transcriptional regulator [Pseudomonas sp. NPDC090203]|uniref:TetR/AcrR family transcriptional regulator n=1 Tax=Pseudomonas sp. NPDC090203 TaxID=3364477 RepID=UPI003823FA13
MKVTKEQAALNKAAILRAATDLYRERGIDGIGISELTKAAGLTHGGFYGHFPGGKEQLAAEAVCGAFADVLREWDTADSLECIVVNYLAEQLTRELHERCPIPTLGSDVARCGEKVRGAFTQGVKDMIISLQTRIEGEHSDPEAHAKTMCLLASMAGAMLMANALNDEALSQEFTKAVTAYWSA